MSGHTPGPWAVRFSASGYPYQITAVNGDDKAPGKVGTCVTRWASFMMPSSAEAKANARLIAAAPDLLAALKSARDELMGLPRSLAYELTHLPSIEAAIAKAEGA